MDQTTKNTRVLLYTLPPAGGDLFPISLGYIAATLKVSGIDAVVAEIDKVTKNTSREVTDFVLSYKPMVVGFSVYRANIKLALQLARLIKITDPETIIVFGGPQITFMPKEALRQMRAVDILMRGEGEMVWPELIECIAKNHDPVTVNGIVFMRGNNAIETPPAKLIDDLDHLPSPYQSQVFDLRQHKVAALLSSRGCNFRCAFCYTPRAFGYRIRAHSVKRILSDMEICVKAGIKRFFFADPAFTFDKKRVTAIMQGIIKRHWKIEIWCETRADLVDEKLLRLMAKAGVKYIAYGLESADQQVNKILRKPVDIKNFEKIIAATHKAGITPEVFTLYGLPGQTLKSSLKTVEFLKRLKIKLVDNSAGQQLNLFFGTDITDNPERYGITLLKKRHSLYLCPGVDYTTQYMKRRDMVKAAQAYKK
jgi:anaerobic magnesium-protoporphyrin IX monomethyl ester cyclase